MPFSALLFAENLINGPKINNIENLNKFTRILFTLALKNRDIAKLLLNNDNQFIVVLASQINHEQLFEFAQLYDYELVERLINKAKFSEHLAARMRTLNRDLQKKPVIVPTSADNRTVLAVNHNKLVVEVNGVKGIYGKDNRFIPMINRATRNFNQLLCSIGNDKREAIILDPADPLLIESYEQLKHTLPKTSDTATILEAVKSFTQECFLFSDPDSFINENIAQGKQLLPLSEFILLKKGVCRHHSLLNAYFLSRLSAPDEGILKGEVIHHRQNFGKAGAHTWNIFRDKQGKIYSLDSLWNNVTCISESSGRLNDLYNRRLDSDDRSDIEALILQMHFQKPLQVQIDLLNRKITKYTNSYLKEKIQELITIVQVINKLNEQSQGLQIELSNFEQGLVKKYLSKYFSHERHLTANELIALLKKTNDFLDSKISLETYENFINTNLKNTPSPSRAVLYKIMMAIGALAVVAGVLLASTGVGAIPGAALAAGGLLLAGSGYSLHRYKHSQWNLFKVSKDISYEITESPSAISVPDDNPTKIMQKEHFKFGYYQAKGDHKPTQEDAVAWQMLDEILLANLSPEEIGHRLWTSYQLLDASLFKEKSGTTACTTVYDGKGNLITATLADTVAFAAVYDKNGLLLGVIRLNSTTHKPSDEKEKARLKEHGIVPRLDRVWSKNGDRGLAVARSIADTDFKKNGVCAEAQIDCLNIDELLKQKNIPKSSVGKIQIITCCDGLTDVAREQTKKGHEKHLYDSLKQIPDASQLNEAQLAKTLTDKAYKAGSRDNVSIAIQTIDLKRKNPLIVGIYDGHGGAEAASFVAKNINKVFKGLCSKSSAEYEAHPLSVFAHAKAYLRDHQSNLVSLDEPDSKSSLKM